MATFFKFTPIHFIESPSHYKLHCTNKKKLITFWPGIPSVPGAPRGPGGPLREQQKISISKFDNWLVHKSIVIKYIAYVD